MIRWLTRAQVAEKLNTHPNSLYRLEKKPGFPKRSETLGVPRWREDEIEHFMEKGRRRQRPSEPPTPPKRAGRALAARKSAEAGHDT